MWRIREFFRSIANFWKFRKEIWRFRWWDFSYQEAMIYRMLDECDKNWQDSHYEGSEFTHGRIKVLKKLYEEYENTYDIMGEYRLQQEFLQKYSKMLPRLWD